jgi:acyl carrier protein
MTTKDEIRQQVLAIVSEVAEVPVERITWDSMLADLDVDSLRGLRIVAEVEKRWGVLIDEEQIGKIRSMRDVLALVEGKTPES